MKKRLIVILSSSMILTACSEHARSVYLVPTHLAFTEEVIKQCDFLTTDGADVDHLYFDPMFTSTKKEGRQERLLDDRDRLLIKRHERNWTEVFLKHREAGTYSYILNFLEPNAYPNNDPNQIAIKCEKTGKTVRVLITPLNQSHVALINMENGELKTEVRRYNHGGWFNRQGATAESRLNDWRAELAKIDILP